MLDKLKNAWKSLTIWFNGVVGSIAVGLPLMQESMPQVREYLPDDVFKTVALVLVVGNVLLRFKTNSDLSQK